ncbi:hypothetical protein ACQB60_04510 [Actinomycetota bacterium Odt1-20B]
MRTHARVLPLTLTGVLLGGALAAVAAAPAGAGAGVRPDAGVQSCYGSAQKYTAVGYPSLNTAIWPDGRWATTTSKCADINVKTNYTRNVRVCWETGACTGFTLAREGKWTVAAPRVPNGTRFRLYFRGANNGTGKVAY